MSAPTQHIIYTQLSPIARLASLTIWCFHLRFPKALTQALFCLAPHAPATHTHTQVYAIDLIGFGASDKPVQQYTIELWADLINDFLSEFAAGTPAVVVGNSIGSLSVLTAAAARPQGLAQQPLPAHPTPGQQQQQQQWSHANVSSNSSVDEPLGV